MQTEQLKNTHLEEVSNEIDELISYSPHWFIRSGNAIFFIVLIVILSLTWLIKYPDIIIGTARLAAINAPKLVTTRIEGKLEKIKIHNEQIVEKDQPIAFLQSTGSHEDILELEKWINKVELIVLNDDLKIIMKRQIPLLNNLGEIQSAYQEFQNVLRETQETFGNGYYKQKSLALTQDLALLSEVNGNATKQRQLVQNDFELQQIEYKAKESLAKDRIIAPLEFNQDKSKMLSKEQVMEQISAQLIINRITEHNKKKEILDLNKYVSDQKQLFRSALLNLKSRVEDWIQRYIILAPVKGRVFFTSFLQENQLVSIGQNLFRIISRSKWIWKN